MKFFRIYIHLGTFHFLKDIDFNDGLQNLELVLTLRPQYIHLLLLEFGQIQMIMSVNHVTRPFVIRR